MGLFREPQPEAEGSACAAAAMGQSWFAPAVSAPEVDSGSERRCLPGIENSRRSCSEEAIFVGAEPDPEGPALGRRVMLVRLESTAHMYIR